MPKGVAVPTAEDIRCPTCSAIDWRRLGERVLRDADDGSNAGLRHELVNENGPFDWTCESCGYRAKPGSHLDHMVSKVQSRPRVSAGALASLGGLGALLERSRGAGSAPSAGGTGTSARAKTAGGLQGAAIVSAVVVGITSVGLVWLVTRPSGGTDSTGTAAPQATEAPANAGATAGATDRNTELESVEVLSVTGDVTFWVGPSEPEQTFVVLDESIQGETAVTVRAGQRLRIIGTMMQTPVEGVHLSASDEKALEKETSYLRARWVEIVDG